MYSVMDVKKEVVHSIVSEIENLKPSYIEGYTGSLVKLARFIEEHPALRKFARIQITPFVKVAAGLMNQTPTDR